MMGFSVLYGLLFCVLACGTSSNHVVHFAYLRLVFISDSDFCLQCPEDLKYILEC